MKDYVLYLVDKFDLYIDDAYGVLEAYAGYSPESITLEDVIEVLGKDYYTLRYTNNNLR